MPRSSRATNGPSDEIQPVSTHSAGYFASLPSGSGWLIGIGAAGRASTTTSPLAEASCDTVRLALLHHRAAGVVDLEHERPLLAEVLVDGLAAAVPVAVVVDDQDPARLQPREEVRQLVAGRLVPVGVEPQDGDLLRGAGRDGLQDVALDEVALLGRVAGGVEVGGDVLEAGVAPLAVVVRQGFPVEFLGRVAAVVEVPLGGLRHAGVGVE